MCRDTCGCAACRGERWHVCLDKGRSREGEGEPAFKGEYFSRALDSGARFRFAVGVSK